MNRHPIQSKPANTTYLAHEIPFLFSIRPLHGGRTLREQSGLDGGFQKAFQQE
jgi:hypothetical protein